MSLHWMTGRRRIALAAAAIAVTAALSAAPLLAAAPVTVTLVRWPYT